MSADRAAPLPRFHGTLAIGSSPDGAQVFVNRQPRGSTPIVLEHLPAGSHVVRIEADGYHLWSAAVRVVAGQRTRVTAQLNRAAN